MCFVKEIESRKCISGEGFFLSSWPGHGLGLVWALALGPGLGLGPKAWALAWALGPGPWLGRWALGFGPGLGPGPSSFFFLSFTPMSLAQAEVASAFQTEFLHKKARVEFETEDHFTLYGEFGLVTKVMESTQEVTLQTDKIAFTVPASIVRVRLPRQFETKPLGGFQRLGWDAKQAYLHELGHWNPEASAPIEAVSLTKPARLEDEQIKLFNVILKATFPKADFEMIDPCCILRDLMGEHCEPSKLEFLSNALREAYTSKQKIILPIQCEECTDHPMGHWTALVIDKSAEQLQVPYRTIVITF